MEESMTRIAGVDPNEAEATAAAAFRAQTERWGAPLVSHTIYARRPTIYRGVRGMWGGLDGSGLLDPKLAALVNRRVATINRCEF
jgi:hypothetical protein